MNITIDMSILLGISKSIISIIPHLKKNPGKNERHIKSVFSYIYGLTFCSGKSHVMNAFSPREALCACSCHSLSSASEHPPALARNAGGDVLPTAA